MRLSPCGASPSSPTSTPTCRRCEAALARIDELEVDGLYCGGDLVGYGPHPERGVRADRRSARSRRSTATTTTPSRATSRTAAAPTSRRTTASSASSRSTGRWRTPTSASKDFMRELPFDLRFAVGERRCTSSTARRARSTSTCSRTSRRACTSASPPPRSADVLVFGHTHKPWIHEFGGVLFVNCGSVGKPKDGDPRAAFAVLEADGDGVRARDRARGLRRRRRRAGGRRRGPAGGVRRQARPGRLTAARRVRSSFARWRRRRPRR